MITHEITKYNYKKQHISNGSKEHREHILERNLNAALRNPKLTPGTFVNVKDRREKGSIIYHEDDIKLVQWDGLKVKFIEVWFPQDNTTAFYHPSDLKV